LDEREAKLKALTANIKKSIDKCVPIRAAKLAFVDVKPPRNVLKKQAKYGTANVTSTSVSDVKRRLGLNGGTPNNATNIVVPSPPMSRFNASSKYSRYFNHFYTKIVFFSRLEISSSLFYRCHLVRYVILRTIT